MAMAWLGGYHAESQTRADHAKLLPYPLLPAILSHP
jgi:hypothetical protein